jgi:phage/plasmid-like protein (TIGR03299 family)
VSQRFQEVQPMEILHFYRDLTEQSGFELETAGVLKGGKKFWALARTGQSSALKGKDVSNGYILLATACDGTLATTAQFTSIRVVCNNTLAIALKDRIIVQVWLKFHTVPIRCGESQTATGDFSSCMG